jgi:hypothetical protein
MLRSASAFLAATAAAVLFMAPAHADELDDVVFQLEATQEDLLDLSQNGHVQFTSSTARLQYRRALRRLARAIQDLDDMGGGGGPSENWRGRAVVEIRRHVHSAYAGDAIAKLPSWVTKDDFDFLVFAAQDMHSAYVADAFGAYYQNGSHQNSRNRKGVAAKAVVQELHSAYVADVLAVLPAYVSQDDASFLAFLVQDLHSAHVKDAIMAFNAKPSSPRRGNKKGSAARMIVDEVHSAYRNDCLMALPAYVSEGDLPYLQQLVDDTHSANLADALREFFGSRAAS